MPWQMCALLFNVYRVAIPQQKNSPGHLIQHMTGRGSLHKYHGWTQWGLLSWPHQLGQKRPRHKLPSTCPPRVLPGTKGLSHKHSEFSNFSFFFFLALSILPHYFPLPIMPKSQLYPHYTPKGLLPMLLLPKAQDIDFQTEISKCQIHIRLILLFSIIVYIQ